MHDLIHNLKENAKKIDRFTLWVLKNGLILTLGLVFLAVFFESLVGRVGDIVTVLSCVQGARDAASAMLGITLIGAFLSDIIIKNRKGVD